MALLSKVFCLCLAIPVVKALGGTKIGRVSAGPIEISSLGCGTWSWGNKLLWDYDPSQDEEIYRAYRAVRDAGVTIFDTADSYGTLQLNGRAEILLGQFERKYQDELTREGAFGVRRFLGSNAAANSNKQQIATKIAPYPWRITRGSLVQAARESLARIGQDSECSLRLRCIKVNCVDLPCDYRHPPYNLERTLRCSGETRSQLKHPLSSPLEQPLHSLSTSAVCVVQLHWSTANYQPFQEGKCLLFIKDTMHIITLD